MNKRPRVGVIVLCRYDSNRLPGKILKKIKGKEILGYVCERLSLTTKADGIVVATSVEENDDIIIDFCERHNINYFRGSKNNVAERIVQCAKEYNFDYFVRICGDNVFTDYKLVDEMIGIAVQGDYDFVSNIKGRTFPPGISVEILKTDFYEKLVPNFKTAEHKEHVTMYLYENESEAGKHHFVYCEADPDVASVKLVLDDDNNFRFIKSIIENMDKDHTRYLFNDICELSREISNVNR